MISFRTTLPIAALVAMVASPVAYASTVMFDFEDQPFGAVTPLVSSAGGLSANFASPTDSASFQISGGFYKTLTGNYLTSPGPDFTTGNTLTITFSQGVRAIDFAFATDTDPKLSLLTDTGISASATGYAPGGSFLYPEGVLAVAGGYFRSVTLSSSALSFAIDNLAVTVPEPQTLSIVGLGLAGAGLARRRRTRAAA